MRVPPREKDLRHVCSSCAYVDYYNPKMVTPCLWDACFRASEWQLASFRGPFCMVYQYARQSDTHLHAAGGTCPECACVQEAMKTEVATISRSGGGLHSGA